jgi:hypothetical protein
VIESLEFPRAWVFPGPPHIMAKERAILECGCFVAVGLQTATKEPALIGTACGDDHKPKMREFLRRYDETLENPSSRPAVEVADEVLGEVYAE